MYGGAAAILVATALTPAPFGKRVGLVVGSLALLWLASSYRYQAELAFAHLHNWIAVLWLCSLFSRPRHRWLLLAGLLGFTGSLFAIPFEWIDWIDATPAGIDYAYHAAVLAPIAVPELGLRLVLAFAFAQAFHYAVWVRLVPELMRRRRAPRSFGASYAALARDFSPTFMLLVLVSMVALAGAALYALREAREAYLNFALFHGYLELAFAGVWWLSGLAPGAEGSRRR
jgi:hypothetical protein